MGGIRISSKGMLLQATRKKRSVARSYNRQKVILLPKIHEPEKKRENAAAQK